MPHENFTRSHRIFGISAAWAIFILEVAYAITLVLGLIGVPLADMQIRMIGVLGYAGIAPIAFLMLGFVFRQSKIPDPLSARHP